MGVKHYFLSGVWCLSIGSSMLVGHAPFRSHQIDNTQQQTDDLAHYLTYLVLDEHNHYFFKTYDFSTINNSGLYQLVANVSTQITINVSNVTLDLNGQVVSGGTDGILINSGLHDITIKNGTISGVDNNGIEIASDCSHITVQNVAINDALIGISCDTVTDSVIQNCTMSRTTTGMMLDTCANMVVRGCIANQTVQAGYDLLSTLTCSLIECKALGSGSNNTQSSGDAANVFGFVSRNGTGNSFNQCIARSTQNLTATAFDVYVAGFGFRGSETSSTIAGCQASNGITNAGGNTVPFGILLEGTMNSLNVAVQIAKQGSALNFAGISSWSPDGLYILLPSNPNANGTGAVQLIRYDRTTNTTTITDDFTLNSGVWASSWSPDGNFVVVQDGDRGVIFAPGTVLYELDRANEVLIFRDLQEWDTSAFPAQTAVASEWSYDGVYIVVGGENSGTAPRYNVIIYEFDRIKKTLTERDKVSFNNAPVGDDVYDVAWTNDGKFFTAVGDAQSSISAITYPFDRATKTATIAAAITMSPDPGGGLKSLGCHWSYDDRYVAIVSTLNNSANTRIYRFDGSSFTLVDSVDNSAVLPGAPSAARGPKIRWSPDGRYVAVSGTGSTTGQIVKLYSFNRSSETLTQVATYTNGSVRTEGVAWAPDGSSLLVPTGLTGSNIALIFTGIIFPEHNVIINNMVYGNVGGLVPSGVGISGSSIKNMIVGNNAFANAANYFFVTNVFNQLFNNAPLAVQNTGKTIYDPIQTPLDVPTMLQRIELLTESLIDNLL